MNRSNGILSFDSLRGQNDDTYVDGRDIQVTVVYLLKSLGLVAFSGVFEQP